MGSLKMQRPAAKTSARYLNISRHPFDRSRHTAGLGTARLPVRKQCATITTKYSAYTLWMPLPGEKGFEKIMLGALVLAAGAAIAYGLWTMLDYVQNWSVINAWVARIISS